MPAASEVPRGTIALQAGFEFGASWAEQATDDEVKVLLGQNPRIPVTLDAQLLREAERNLGSLREDQGIKKIVRKGFWDSIKEHKLQ